MARKLIVYGGTIFLNGGVQVRAVVATKKRACELFGVTPSFFNGYCSPTGNALEVSTATLKPDTVFICGNRYRSNPIYVERDAAQSSSVINAAL